MAASPPPAAAPITIYVDPAHPGTLHVAVPKSTLGTKASPIFVQAVPNEHDPAVMAAINLDRITVGAVVVALLVPLIIGFVERNRRRVDHDLQERHRNDDNVAEAQLRALQDEAAREQLVNILQQLERLAAALEAMPRMPLRSSLEAMEPFVSRALASDVAQALGPEEQTKVYTSLALAQSQFALAADYHDQINEGIEKLERERIAAQSTGREYKRLQDHLKESEERFNREADPRFKERLLSEVLDTKRAGSELETSQEFIGMREFLETQERRRDEIKNIPEIIRGNAASVREHLRAAREVLGDRSEIAAPIREKPLADGVE